jgi:hypothetical protein
MEAGMVMGDQPAQFKHSSSTSTLNRLLKWLYNLAKNSTQNRLEEPDKEVNKQPTITKEELLLEQWKMASELHRHEDNMTWNRFIYFLTINGILLSVFGTIVAAAVVNKVVLSIMISAFGAFISLAWFMMQIRGKFYHRYRNEQAKDVERRLLVNNERVLTLYETGLDEQILFEINPLWKKLIFLSTNNLVLLLSLVAFVLWLFSSIYFSYLCSRTTPTCL